MIFWNECSYPMIIVHTDVSKYLYRHYTTYYRVILSHQMEETIVIVERELL